MIRFDEWKQLNEFDEQSPETAMPAQLDPQIQRVVDLLVHRIVSQGIQPEQVSVLLNTIVDAVQRKVPAMRSSGGMRQQFRGVQQAQQGGLGSATGSSDGL